MKDYIVKAHTSFVGYTGFNKHSQDFFRSLNKKIPVRIRNFTVDEKWNASEEDKKLLTEQTFTSTKGLVNKPSYSSYNDSNKKVINIVLNETHHYYFYDEYDSPSIAYNVWESTRQPDQFFNRLFEFDQLWVPTQWQKQVTIEQGYPEDKIKIVPEAVDGSLFFPYDILYNYKDNPMEEYHDGRFKFLLFGRWDYRKSTKEIIETFLRTFGPGEPVDLIVSIDNPYDIDGLKTTENRLDHYEINDHRIKIKTFMSDQDYITYLKSGHVFVSCARSEGWNRPLAEAMACGIPTISSNCSGQLEFTTDKVIFNGPLSHKVNIVGRSQADVGRSGSYAMGKPSGNDGVNSSEKIVGEYYEPDFDHLSDLMRNIYSNYEHNLTEARISSQRMRNKYSLKNAADIAYYHMNELVTPKTRVFFSNKSKKEVKLNLGCGNDIKEGFVNIDMFNNISGVDLVANIIDLPYVDKSVDYIYSGHSLEHIEIPKITAALKNWNRILKKDSILEIEVPDLEWSLKRWLNETDQNKYVNLELIFGNQDYLGDFHYAGFTRGSLKVLLEEHDFKFVEYKSTIDRNIRIVVKKEKDFVSPEEVINFNFVDGPFCEVLSPKREYHFIKFFDMDTKSHVHFKMLATNHWTRGFRKYFTRWKLVIEKDNKILYEHEMNLKDKRVFISIESSSLGDTIAWFPYVEAFRRKHKCHIIVSMWWIELFKDNYPAIEFVNPGTVASNLYAGYKIGWFDKDSQYLNPKDYKTIPLQQAATDILGLDFNEVKPNIVIPDIPRQIEGKYVCIGIHSTCQAKYWNNPKGWQEVVNFLKNSGYKVVLISKESGTYMGNAPPKGIIDKSGDLPIQDRINDLHHADAFIGLGSGLSWLAWGVGTPTIMIAGHSLPMFEIRNGISRIVNTDVCHGCFNDPNEQFNRSDWVWCPRNKNFECTRSIGSDIVINELGQILKGII